MCMFYFLDWVLASTSASTGVAVIVFCVLSLIITILTISFAIFVLVVSILECLKYKVIKYVYYKS